MASAAKSEGKGVGAQPARTTTIQLLGINDFHGNLEPPSGSSGRIGTVNAGGVEYLATHLEQLEATNPNTLVVSAGDLIGASPLLSGLFHDEPTIEAANIFGLDFNAVGNHEFDEGAVELLRMQEGGCHPVDGCQDGDGFTGADFAFLAANVKWHDTGETLFPAYKIAQFQGVKVALIGMTLEGTPTIVSPSGVAGLDFLDEADTVNALIPELREQGVKTIVVLIHEGGFPAGGFNECPGISGPIVDIVNRTSDEVDLFISGHTHQAYNCVIDGRPVTSAASFGRLITDFDVTISRATKQPVSITVDNKIVTRDVAKDETETALILKYKQFADPIANRVIGTITTDITRAANAAQPFGNSLVTMTLTGAQIDTLLEQQFDNPAVGQSRMLQVSNGFTYTWNAAAPTGSKVDPSTIKIGGVVVDPATSYRVTVNSFLADGGDNFSVLTQGTDRLGGDVDTDAMVDYFAANSPVAPGPQNRITRVG